MGRFNELLAISDRSPRIVLGGVYIETREYRISIYIGATMSRVVTERMVKSFLDLFVLDLLDDSPKHGYEIMRELKTRTGARIGAGTLYPLLYELEERKLVAGEWNSPNRRSRRVYRITEPGAKYKKNGFKGIDLLIRSSSSDSGT